MDLNGDGIIDPPEFMVFFTNGKRMLREKVEDPTTTRVVPCPSLNSFRADSEMERLGSSASSPAMVGLQRGLHPESARSGDHRADLDESSGSASVLDTCVKEKVRTKITRRAFFGLRMH